MKFMTYNILNGGLNRLPLIIKIIKKENPDYVTFNEANTFSQNKNKILKNIAKKLDFPHYDIALSGEYDYHVAVLSKYPLKNIVKLKPLMRACLISQVDTKLGEVSIASLHLTPYTEDLRHPEIDLILKYQKKYKNRILTGDMNSLAKHDKYNPKMIKNFNEIQTKKFTTDGKFRFDAINKIISKKYLDTALLLKKNNEYTAPTSINEYSAHSNMRLDYFFISETLKPHLKNYQVIKNKVTNSASDHYPITITLS